MDFLLGKLDKSQKKIFKLSKVQLNLPYLLQMNRESKPSVQIFFIFAIYINNYIYL